MSRVRRRDACLLCCLPIGVLLVFALAACNSGHAARPGAVSPVAAVETYARAVVTGDESLAREVTKPDSCMNDIATVLTEDFLMTAPTTRPVDINVGRSIAAGDDPDDRGYSVSVFESESSRPLASVTIYAGEDGGRYYVWGVSR